MWFFGFVYPKKCNIFKPTHSKHKMNIHLIDVVGVSTEVTRPPFFIHLLIIFNYLLPIIHVQCTPFINVQ